MTKSQSVHVIGGGLAGCEAAWQALLCGHKVVLYEMRPRKCTEAHKTGDLAELVCSNSMKSMLPHTASGELKQEMQMMESLIIESALKNRIPAGMALAIDRKGFSDTVKQKLFENPNFSLVESEITSIPDQEELERLDQVWIVATGPLTSKKLASHLDEIFENQKRLYFYDAIAPTIDADSIDYTKCYFKNRYDDGADGDYLNIPLTKNQYEVFIDEIAHAKMVPLHSFEKISFFEACLPIEVMVERGKDTLRFGPMKPVGLETPDGNLPWAVIQLRAENIDKTMFSMVGFQTKMSWTEQKRIFTSLPGLENAEFLRLGSIHKNTYVNGPEVLNSDLSVKGNRRIFLSGQITGVEGYTESSAIGLLAGRFASNLLKGDNVRIPPKGCMMGALHHYVTNGSLGKYSPMNANLGLLPGMKRTKGMSKKDKKAEQVKRAREVFSEYFGVRSDVAISKV